MLGFKILFCFLKLSVLSKNDPCLLFHSKKVKDWL